MTVIQGPGTHGSQEHDGPLSYGLCQTCYKKKYHEHLLRELCRSTGDALKKIATRICDYWDYRMPFFTRKLPSGTLHGSLEFKHAQTQARFTYKVVVCPVPTLHNRFGTRGMELKVSLQTEHELKYDDATLVERMMVWITGTEDWVANSFSFATQEKCTRKVVFSWLKPIDPDQAASQVLSIFPDWAVDKRSLAFLVEGKRVHYISCDSSDLMLARGLQKGPMRSDYIKFALGNATFPEFPAERPVEVLIMSDASEHTIGLHKNRSPPLAVMVYRQSDWDQLEAADSPWNTCHCLRLSREDPFKEFMTTHATVGVGRDDLRRTRPVSLRVLCQNFVAGKTCPLLMPTAAWRLYKYGASSQDSSLQPDADDPDATESEGEWENYAEFLERTSKRRRSDE